MTPLEYIREARERRKISRVAFSVLEGVDLSNSGFDDCDKLRRTLSQALNEAGIETTRILVTSSPSGRYLGHVVRPQQNEHEIVGIHSGVIDPLYPRSLPLDDYLRRVYQPEEGVELIVTLQQA